MEALLSDRGFLVLGFRLPGLPVVPGTVDKLLREWFGYCAIVRNGEWYVPPTDRKLRAGPEDALTVHSRIELAPDNLEAAAQRLAAAVPTDFDDYAETLPPLREIEVARGLGLISDLDEALSKITVCSKQGLAACLARDLLPIMVSKLGARYVVPVSLNAAAQQSRFSFTKIALLIEKFGVSKFNKLINEAKVFAGIEMSGGLDILGVVDALTRLAPVTFTFPVRRHGCAWHFYGDGFGNVKSAWNRGLLQVFLHGINPRFTGIVLKNLFGLERMGEPEIWQLIRQSVFGVNRLMAVLNDPRTYVDSSEKWDFLKQIQAYGTAQVLFADLLAMNYCTEPHSQISFAYGFLDKLANLKKNLLGLTESEDALSARLASIAQGKDLKRIYRLHMADYHPMLTTSLLPVVGRCFGRLHRELGKQMEQRRGSEASRLEYFRALRNFSHGIFLRGGKFEKLFLSSNVEAPSTLGTLPFLLAHGLAAAPGEFLRFK